MTILRINFRRATSLPRGTSMVISPDDNGQIAHQTRSY
jgi:hypothetical protein